MVELSKLRAVNFMQYEELDFWLDRKGFSSVTGANRAGKSSIIEATIWCLYGETARSAKNVIMRGKRECSVMVTGTVDSAPFSVVRTRKPNKETLKFRVNGKEYDYGTLDLSQRNLDKLLHMDARMFMMSVLFGHNSFRFTRARDSERKEIFEWMLPLQKFEEARIQASDLHTQAERKLLEARTRYDTLLKLQTSMTERMNKAKAEETLAVQNQIKNLRDMVSREKARYYDFPEDIRGLDLGIIAADIRMADAKLTEASLRLKTIQESAICPACGQAISPGHAKRERERLSKELRILQTHIDSMKERHALVEAANECRIRLEQKSEVLADANKELAELKSEKTGTASKMKSEISAMEKECEGLSKIIENLKTEVARYGFWKVGFSRRGVQSLLVDEAIAALNEYVMEASQGMTGGFLQIQFTPSTETKSGKMQERIDMTVLLDGVESEYENLSNSEQQRADMIVMFGLQRMAEVYGGGVNVVFFDEVMEGLDEKSADDVMRYILEIRKARPTVFISHILYQALYKPDHAYVITRDSHGSHIQKTR